MLGFHPSRGQRHIRRDRAAPRRGRDGDEGGGQTPPVAARPGERRRSERMAILPIRQLGDPVLREVARPVTRFDASLARLAQDMKDTMYDAPGVGLAAPQIGVSLRLIVYDDGSGEGARSIANPEVFDLEGEEVREEGCLSVRGPFSELA